MVFSTNYCSISLKIQSNSHLFTQGNDLTVLFQTIQFSISRLFAHCLNASSICSIDSNQRGTTTPGECESGSNVNEGVLLISSSSSTVASP